MVTIGVIYLAINKWQVGGNAMEHFNAEDDRLQKLDQMINASVTCPYDKIQCRKLCDGKIRVQYLLKDNGQEETELFDDEKDFIDTWNKLTQKYPSISKCVNPLKICQQDQCPTQLQPGPVNQIVVPPPTDQRPSSKQETPVEQRALSPNGLAQQMQESPPQTAPSRPVRSKKNGRTTIRQLKNQLRGLEEQLGHLQRKTRQEEMMKQELVNDQLTKKKYLYPSKRNSKYSVVSDRMTGPPKEKVDRHQLHNVLNKLVARGYINSDDYPKIIKDLQENNDSIIETHTDFSKDDSVVKTINRLEQKINGYYQSLKKICRKEMAGLDARDLVDLDDDDYVRRKNHLKSSKSKLDSEYEGIKDLLEQYRYELKLCRRYGEPGRSKDIERNYQSDLNRLDNRFLEQLLQYQSLMNLSQPKAATPHQVPAPPGLAATPGIGDGSCQNKCRIVCGERGGT
jgi:hypothetical protein